MINLGSCAALPVLKKMEEQTSFASEIPGL
jgi:hypothetical protein